MSLVTVQHTISMGHRLPSYDGICSSPHGHNITVEVVVESAGMFIDFKKLSDLLRNLLEPFDHAMVLYHEDELARVLNAFDRNFRVITLNAEPSTENLAQFFFDSLWSDVKTSIDSRAEVVRVTVHETAKYSAITLHTKGTVHRT